MNLDLAIVTCATPNYAVYLADWAKSICRLDRKPAMCGIVLNGSTPEAIGLMEAAAEKLRGAGLRVETQVIESANIGVSRNAAVALSDTEWVMHFDCDDMLMPHALDDIAALAPKADVVCLGYERCGDLASGPRQRTKLYKSSRGVGTLNNLTPCSGVSPYRRSFWEKSPYRTDMDGGWDTALWLGFAHLNARFVPTKRPCFWYRQHADSTFNVRRLDERKGKKVGTKLQSLRRGDSGVSLIVPRHHRNEPSRDASWKWLRARYQSLLPEWEIVEGVCPGDVWCKGAAINRAVAQSKGEVLVIADSDCWVDSKALLKAVELVRTGRAPWVVPHTKVHRWNDNTSQDVYRLSPDTDLASALKGGKTVRVPYVGFAGGGIVVLTRASLDYVKGFPERFQGWGAEDEAFAVILDTLLGQHTRFDADLQHFWHPVGPRLRDRHYQTNRAIKKQYDSASGDPDLMYSLLTTGPQGRVLRREYGRTARQLAHERVRVV